MNHFPIPALELPVPPQRVVSLVPSLSESLCDLGLQAALVGVTDYCIHPADKLSGLPHLGGTKNPDLKTILALQPDLVLANREENTRPVVEAMQAAGLNVWLTFPQTVRQALEVLWQLANVFESKPAALRLDALERSLDWAEAAAAEAVRPRTFCPIWYDPAHPWWMTFNRHTYPHDLLSTLGADNIFADRQRLYPLEADLGLAQPEDAAERDTRYPRLVLEEIRTAQPELVLLPSEPYAFTELERDQLRQLLAGTPAVENGRMYLVDGSLITWHGTRLARAMEELPQLILSSSSH